MSEMNEGPQLKMKSDITRPRPACLICCTIHCCSRLDNCAYSPWYDTAKAFSCGSFCESERQRALSPHKVPLQWDWAAAPLGCSGATASDCNIKISAQFLCSEVVHMHCNADALLMIDDVKLHKALFWNSQHTWITARGWNIWKSD